MGTPLKCMMCYMVGRPQSCHTRKITTSYRRSYKAKKKGSSVVFPPIILSKDAGLRSNCIPSKSCDFVIGEERREGGMEGWREGRVFGSGWYNNAM